MPLNETLDNTNLDIIKAFDDYLKVKNFLSLFEVDLSLKGTRRDLSGFCHYFGFNFKKNHAKEDKGFYEISLPLKHNNKYYPEYDADCWYTPNLFKNGAPKCKENVAWVTSLYVDIDGIDGITSPSDGLNQFYKVTDDFQIARPHLVIHTSTNPTVRLQALWLLDPLYVYQNENSIKWWTESVSALVEAYKKEKLFQIDSKVCKNIAGYMRLPFTNNQKCNSAVTILDQRDPKKCGRYTLNDSWIKNLRTEYKEKIKFNPGQKSDADKSFLKNKEALDELDHPVAPTKVTKIRPFKKSSLLMNPQIQYLKEGVPSGYRNYAQYALAKCALADGLSMNQIIDLVLTQNKKCGFPEDEKKVIDVVNRACGVYGPEKDEMCGLDPGIIADMVNKIFNLNFKPDLSIAFQFKANLPDRKFRTPSLEYQQEKTNKKKTKRDKYIDKNVTLQRLLLEIFKLHRQGKLVLPQQSELAKIAGVKYDSLKHYFSQLRRILAFNSKIDIDRKGQTLVLCNTITICLMCKNHIVLKGIKRRNKKIVVTPVVTGGNPQGLSQRLVEKLLLFFHRRGSFNRLALKIDPIRELKKPP